VHVAAILALLVVVGGCLLQIYALEEHNHRQLLAIGVLNRQIADLNFRQNELATKVTTLELDLAKCRLKRPTYFELQEFLRIDQTDRKNYREGQYVCINFAADLKRNAALVGYNVSYVAVNYRGPRGSGGHALNGAYLSDGSWVWIEPQSDKIYVGTIEDYLKSFLRVDWVTVEELAIVW
jgi:hypothetical protein